MAIDASERLLHKQISMILITTQNFLPSLGGIQNYVAGLANALAARGHVLCVLANGQETKEDSALPFKLRRFAGLQPLRRRRKAHAVAKSILRDGVTHVIADSWKSLEHIPAQALTGVEVLCLGHGNEFLVPASSPKAKRIARALAKADVVAANSHFTAGLAQEFITSRTQVHVVLPGVTPPLGASSEWQERPRTHRLLSIARLEPRKGVDSVLEALAALKPLFPDMIYDVVGGGGDLERLTRLADSLGIATHIHFHGRVSEARKSELLRAADLFLLPNRRETRSVEGFGIVFLEAAAFGIPSIAGEDGGTADAVEDGKTGMIVSSGNSGALIDALRRLLSDSEICATMGRNAHERFWSFFAWDRAVLRFEEVLNLKEPA
jgi:glycosyltransferase involved in cell wall biosynthesis